MGKITMHSLLLLFTLGLVRACDPSAADPITIETAQGKITGIRETARNGDEYSAFYGIPFADPPVGEHRWKRPRPTGPWTGTRDGTFSRDECLQNDAMDPSVMTGSEDCLYVNVFTKNTDPKANLKVLVWIHGGAFIFGGAKIYRPDYIMEENVVLVVIQYRLNMFGFLSTEDAEAPGNYGMWDQVEALRWVRTNIDAYGGDPEQVTVMGMSAGGASVHYLMLSPHTEGLFQNAVSLSGSALCWWANVPNPKRNAFKLGDHFECPLKDSKELLDCLRKVPAESLIESHSSLFFDWHVTSAEREPMNVFSPRSDPEVKSPFLPEHPLLMMESGMIQRVPYMLGYTDKEGIWRANQLLPDVPDSPILKDYLDKFDDVTPLALGLFGGQTNQPKEVTQKLLNYFNLTKESLRQDVLNDDTVHRFIDLLSDSMFTYAIDTTAKLHAKNSEEDTYFYMMTFPGEHTLANFRSDGSFGRPLLEPLKRSSHGTDMLLLFPMFPFAPMPPTDVAVSRKFISLLVDFGRSGAPIDSLPDWGSLDTEAPVHAVLDEEFTVEPGLPFQERFGFWEGLNVYWKYSVDRTKKVAEKDEL